MLKETFQFVPLLREKTIVFVVRNFRQNMLKIGILQNFVQNSASRKTFAVVQSVGGFQQMTDVVLQRIDIRDLFIACLLYTSRCV